MPDLHVHEDAPDPRVLIRDLPHQLHSVITKSIRKDPAARFNNVSEIIDELQPLVERMGIKCHSRGREKEKMMGLFLFYKDKHQMELNQLMDRLNSDINEMGAVLRVVHVEDIF